MKKSGALETNLASYHVDVAIDLRYTVIQEVMFQYYGLTEKLNDFLKELSHPYKNWPFIVKEARAFALDYFHLMASHPRGDQAIFLFVDIFLDAIQSSRDAATRGDAADNLLLFLQTIIKSFDGHAETFGPHLEKSFQRVRNLNHNCFSLFIQSFYQIRKLGALLLNQTDGAGESFEQINLLLIRYCRETYAYWLSIDDPRKWFEAEVREDDPEITLDGVFTEISHERIRQWEQELDHISENEDIHSRETLRRLVELPGFGQIVEAYRNIPHRLRSVGKPNGQGDRWKLIFIFHIMNISGLSVIHEQTLREMNSTLTRFIGRERTFNVQKMVDKTFSILKTRAHDFPDTALSCVLNMGRAVYKTDDSDLINLFIDSLIGMGFHAPMIDGVGDDWQIKANMQRPSPALTVFWNSNHTMWWHGSTRATASTALAVRKKPSSVMTRL